jgi:hypothetical protein
MMENHASHAGKCWNDFDLSTNPAMGKFEWSHNPAG